MLGFLSLGDIQIGMVEKKGALEVEVIRARGLVGKPGSKSLPGNLSVTLLLKQEITHSLIIPRSISAC